MATTAERSHPEAAAVRSSEAAPPMATQARDDDYGSVRAIPFLRFYRGLMAGASARSRRLGRSETSPAARRIDVLSGS
jgi:hypothetical protein